MEVVKYITNKELLNEIDRSKQSYSYFTDNKYRKFDAVVYDLKHITPEYLDSIHQQKIDILTKQGLFDPANPVSKEDVVFRLMTHEHIPIDPSRKPRPKILTDEGQTRTPFPPFKHFIMINGTPTEVGRSHWKGNLETGNFCIEHGKITNRLAIMLMLLVERLAKRGNWRGYCVDEQTEALTQRGWLNIDQINENDIILSYNEGKLAWSKIKSIFRDDYDGNMFKLTVKGMDALVTPKHKFITNNGLKEVDYLLEKDKIIMSGDAVADGNAIYTDNYITKLGLNSNELPMEMIVSLPQYQRELLIQTMINSNNNKSTEYCHRDKTKIDGFLALCTISGYRTEVSQIEEIHTVRILDNKSKSSEVKNINFHGAKTGNISHPNQPTTYYNGKVWCPETEYGSFMARRNGTIYLTGNTYNDEMQSLALLQLSQVGLQFDEAKSENPFAFYTQVAKNSFLRCLNIERKNHSIRDDLLIIAGVQPSYTRQVEHEIEQRAGEQPTVNVPSVDISSTVVELPKKRGRKPKNQITPDSESDHS